MLLQFILIDSKWHSRVLSTSVCLPKTCLYFQPAAQLLLLLLLLLLFVIAALSDSRLHL